MGERLAAVPRLLAAWDRQSQEAPVRGAGSCRAPRRFSQISECFPSLAVGRDEPAPAPVDVPKQDGETPKHDLGHVLPRRSESKASVYVQAGRYVPRRRDHEATLVSDQVDEGPGQGEKGPPAPSESATPRSGHAHWLTHLGIGLVLPKQPTLKR